MEHKERGERSCPIFLSPKLEQVMLFLSCSYFLPIEPIYWATSSVVVVAVCFLQTILVDDESRKLT